MVSAKEWVYFANAGCWAMLSLIVHIGINPRLIRSAEGQVLEGTTWKGWQRLTAADSFAHFALKLCSSPSPFIVPALQVDHLGWMCSRWQGDQVERRPSSKHRSHSCDSHVKYSQVFSTVRYPKSNIYIVYSSYSHCIFIVYSLYIHCMTVWQNQSFPVTKFRPLKATTVARRGQ